MTRTPPRIGDPKRPARSWKSKFQATSKEVDAYLKNHGKTLPGTRRMRRRARRLITRKKYLRSLPKGRDFSISQSDAPYQVIYGLARVGGLLTFYHTTENKAVLHQVHTLSCHELAGILEVHLDGNKLSWLTDWPAWSSLGYRIAPDGTSTMVDYTNKIYLEHHWGEPSGSPFPALRAALPDHWTTDHRLYQRGAVYIRLLWDATLFGEENLEFSFLVRGKKALDPRTGTSYSTQNVAINLADYLTDQTFGLGYAWDEIDVPSLIEAANICDEAVPIAGGLTEPRYQMDCSFTVDEDPDSIINEFEKSMCGHITFSAGKWKFFAGAARTPVLTLTMDDLRGPLHVVTMAPREDVVNSVRGSYVSPADNYTSRDFPAVSVASYVTADNGVKRWLDIEYPFITSAARAQRLARAELEISRRNHRIDGPFGLRALELEPGDWVYLDLDRYGYNGTQTFEVEDTSQRLAENEEVQVDLTLREIDANAFEWDTAEHEQAVHHGLANTLPNPMTVDPISDLQMTSGTTELYVQADGTIVSRIHATWDVPDDALFADGGHIELQYKRDSEATFSGDQRLLPSTASTYILPVEDGATYHVRVRTVNALGARSWWIQGVHSVVGKTEPPATVTSVTYESTAGGEAVLRWNAVTDPDLSHYEIRLGATWDAATPLGTSTVPRFDPPLMAAGTNTYLVKAIDTSGNASLSAASYTKVLPVTPAPVVAVTQEGAFLRITWSAPLSAYPIAHYEVRYGADWASATYRGTVGGTADTVPINWVGARTFLVGAVDIAGNVGAPGSNSFSVSVPGLVQGLSAQVISERVLLDWEAPATGTLEVSRYAIYRGATFGTAEKKGEVAGSFSAFFETDSGSFTYHVAAIDVAGNEGPAAAVTTTVYKPTDFIIRADQAVTFAGATTALVLDDGESMVVPVDTSQSWLAAFGANTSLQDEIDDGFTEYLQPTTTTPATIEWLIDYGVILSGSVIQFDWVKETIAGTVNDVPHLETSLDNVTYTDHGNVSEVFVPTVRYAKVRLTATATDNTGLARITSTRVKVSLKKVTDSGTAVVAAADSGGTTIPFNLDFLDIESIVVTPRGTAPRVWVVDFADAPNPTSFKVLLFDLDGVRQDGTISWTAEGALDVLGVS